MQLGPCAPASLTRVGGELVLALNACDQGVELETREGPSAARAAQEAAAACVERPVQRKRDEAAGRRRVARPGREDEAQQRVRVNEGLDGALCDRARDRCCCCCWNGL